MPKCVVYVLMSVLVALCGHVVNGWIFFYRKHASHVDRYDVLTAPRKRKAKNQDAPSTFRQLKLGETNIVSQRNVDQAVLNFVIQSLQLFSVVEQPSCQDLLQDLQPNASLMSRTTL